MEGRRGALAWYSVHVRSNFERKVSSILGDRLGCETWIPTYTARSVRRGVTRDVDRPLFPGYLFMHDTLARERRIEVSRVTGVVGILGVRGRPIPVEDGIMESLRILASRPDHVKPHPFLREGARVVVIAGPFAGARGVLVRGRGRKPRLVVSLHLLGRSVGVDLDPLDVTPDI